MSLARTASCPTHSDSLNRSTTVCMYCFGDVRRLAFSPRASRSRSRWRIFFAFRRHRGHASFERVAAQQRHGEGDDRRAGGNRGEDHRHEALVFEDGEQKIEHHRPQKSKLIIFFMTMTP